MDLVIQYAGRGALRVKEKEKGDRVIVLRVAWQDGTPEGDAADGCLLSPAPRGRTKWNHLSTVRGLYELVEASELVCFADDDVYPVGSWADVFRSFRGADADVGQAAIVAEASYWSHPVTLRTAGLRFRRTNFVEMMAPIMTGRQAIEWWPAFADLDETAWGVELLWSSGVKRCVVLDEAPIVHTRPVRAWDHARRFGRDPEEERRRFAERWTLPYPPASFTTLAEVPKVDA